MEATFIESLLAWIADHTAISGLIVFIIAFTESLAVVGILVPGMSLMLGVGALVGLGTLSLWPVLLWATVGAIAGDGISYWLGRHYDQQLRKMWPFTRYPDLIPKGEKFFLKHGGKSILFGRFVGPMRPIIPAVAGMMHMPVMRFFSMNILSALAWAPVVVLPGAVFGASMQLASDVVWRIALIIIIVTLVLWPIFWSVHKIALQGEVLFGKLVGVNKIRNITLSYSVIFFSFFMMSQVLLTIQMLSLPDNFDKSQWWQSQWREVAQLNKQQNIQWQGTEQEVRKILLSNGWVIPVALNINNALTWLDPESEVASLPLLQSYNLNNETPGEDKLFLFASPDTADNVIYLISLNQTHSNLAPKDEMVLASLKKIKVQEVFFGIRIPRISLIDKFPAHIIEQFASNISLQTRMEQSTQGDVMLVRFGGK